MMDPSVGGPLWFILILFSLLHLTCTCPNGCKCKPQGAVMCVGAMITDIPKDLPSNISMLQLYQTNMNTINEHSLENKDLLLRFGLSHSHLHTIHPRAFAVAPQLLTVKLSSNYLATLPAQVFSPLTALEQLYLDQNQLETIGPEMFHGLARLQYLDLSRNKLTDPRTDVFDGLTNLTSLNLGRNSIKKLPPTIFRSLTKLRSLSIYNNELEVLEDGMFDELVNLEELKLHHNQITSLPPQLFWSLENLVTLTLSSNQFQTTPEKSFYNMPKLSQLTLYNNPLLYLPDELMGHMPEMREFYLYYTTLTTIPGNLFANMSGLLRLNLHLNDKLSQLPSDVFCCLPNLEKLSLKQNNLHYLHPQLFSRLPTLDLLYLNDNKLKSLPENIFQGLRRISTIDLRNNRFTNLPGDVFWRNTILNSLNLSDNPWDCTCSIRGIARWIRHNQHVVVDKEDVICHSPVFQLLRTITSLRDEEFNYCDTTTVPSFTFQEGMHETRRPFSISTRQIPLETSTSPAATKRVTVQATSNRAKSTTLSSTTPLTTLLTSELPETRRPFQIISTSEQLSPTSPGTMPTTSQEVIHQVFISANPKSANPTTLDSTTPSTTLLTSELPETRRPFQIISTSEQLSPTSPGTMPTTSQEVIHQVFISANPKSANPTTLDSTTPSAALMTVSTILPNEEDPLITGTNYQSAAVNHVLVIGQGPRYVHHNFHRGWVYVWHLPSGTAEIGFLMFGHIVLVALGLFLILAAMYSIYRLGRTIDKVEAECVHYEG